VSDPITEWAIGLQKEVYTLWDTEYRGELDAGFQVWYGPVDNSKQILILGLQPGGGPDSFQEKLDQCEQNEFSLPATHEYLDPQYDWDLQRDTKNAVPTDVIENSVKTNITFFRAPRQDDWATILDAETREKLDSFCVENVLELINRAEFDLIITEGTSSVYDTLTSELAVTTDETRTHEVGDENEERLVCVGRTDEFSVIGLTHPSSGRGVGSEDYEEMREVVEEVASQAGVDNGMSENR
jgi:hypothetical protein